MDKDTIRKEALARRKALGASERSCKSAIIRGFLLAMKEFRDCRTIMTYLDFREEVETTAIAGDILKAGKRLVIPLCREKKIVPCEITDLAKDVRLSSFGIREPLPDRNRPVLPDEIDFVLVPGVAFDYRGNRIGYGAGYYDCFLPLLPKRTMIVGLAFSCQLFDRIEAEEHDYRLPFVLTETGMI